VLGTLKINIMADTSSSQRVKAKPDISYLRDIALLLTGYETAAQSLSSLGLGRHHLTTLWESIDFIKRSENLKS
jgi:hypothetical protein